MELRTFLRNPAHWRTPWQQHRRYANVDGDYDKTGLPDPLPLTFYFSVRGDRIVQLIILRNRAAAGPA